MRTILLLTYDISPYKGSESSVGWNFVINMCHSNQLLVIYGKGKKDLDMFCKNNTIPNTKFINIEPFSYSGKGFVKDIKYNFGYLKWHKKVYIHVAELILQHHIDVIHYLNPIGFKEPGFLWKLDKPYVWGPMKGVDNRPFKLYKALNFRGKINALTRRLVHNAMFRYYPRVQSAIKKSNFIFAAVPNTQKQLKSIYYKDSYYLPENGITKMNVTSPVKMNNGILNLIWVGRVDENKALIILLDALRLVNNMNWHLDVCGEGVLFSKMKGIAYKYNIFQNITFHGKLSREETMQKFSNVHLHVISSLGEATTTVLFESMSYGVPTMTLDHCGMSGVVCEKCGIKIPITSYSQVIRDIAWHIDSLIENPDKIIRLSEGVLECSKKYMWEKRVEIFNSTYNTLLNK